MKSLVIIKCITFIFISIGYGQNPWNDEEIESDFLKFIVSKNGKVKRIEKKIIPWDSDKFHLKDSIWARINSDKGHKAFAERGGYGIGPFLRFDLGFTQDDLDLIRKKILNFNKINWSNEDFEEFNLGEYNYNSPDFYYYSLPIILNEKNIIMIQRGFHCGNLCGWSCIEVYRVKNPKDFELIDCYLRRVS